MRLLNLLVKLVKLKLFSYEFFCFRSELTNSWESQRIFFFLLLEDRGESSLPNSGEAMESFVSRGDFE